MKIYNYNASGFFICETDADIDPLESKKNGENVYLIPAYATNIKPPDITVNQRLIFVDNAWEIEEDYTMEKSCEIDANGIFIREHLFLLGEIPTNTYILAETPSSDFYKAKWDGEKWIEIATQEEITVIQAERDKNAPITVEKLTAEIDSLKSTLTNYDQVLQEIMFEVLPTL